MPGLRGGRVASVDLEGVTMRAETQLGGTIPTAAGLALSALLATLAASLLALAPTATGQGGCFGSSPTITGAGEIEGTDGDDVILGSGGDDRVSAKGGNDKICTGAGNDRVGAGPGNDEVDGGAGDDEIDGGPGDDSVLGSEGDDVMRCGPGTDVADGGSGTNSAAGSGFEACETIRNASAVDVPTPMSRMQATLTPRQEVRRPRDARRARGSFKGTLTRTESGGDLTWRLKFRRLTGRAVEAHIHRGKRGKAGPVVLELCSPCRSGMRGTVDVEGDELFSTIRRGGTYVNVHTKKNRRGEIRGQVTRIPE
jgi:hypothetical protein